MTAPQLSPGGQWWWTGDAWVAAADHPDGAAALAALQAPAVPAQPTPEPVAQAPAPVVPEAAAPAPEPYRPPGWAPPTPAFTPAASTAPSRTALTSLAKPVAIGAGVLGAVVLLAAVVVPAITGAGKQAADTVQKPIVAAQRAVLEADAQAAAQAEAASFVENGSYVGLAGLTASGYRSTSGVRLQVLRADRTGYCLRLSEGTTVGWVGSPGNVLTSAPCR